MTVLGTLQATRAMVASAWTNRRIESPIGDPHRWSLPLALHEAASNDADFVGARLELVLAIDHRSLTEWADEDGRTLADVLDAIDRAIAEVERRGPLWSVEEMGKP